MNLPAISDRPENLPISGRRTSFADVFMLIAKDGPVYAIIAVVGVLAMRGTASTAEAVIAALAALLSKSWPRPIQMGGVATLALVVVARVLVACAQPPLELVPKAAKDAVLVSDYAHELDRCVEVGKDAGSRARYEECARAADVTYGRKDASP